MSVSRITLVALASLFVTSTHAQDEDFRIWSSFLYLRAGERTPSALSSVAPTLTSLGAQQMYSAGQYFRSQYLEEESVSRIQELDVDTPRTDQVYALTIDTQFTSASTQAFLTGMWPPNEDDTPGTDGVPNRLVNGTIIQDPQGGLNLPRISSAGVQDIDSLFVGGDIACPGFGGAASEAISESEIERLIEESQATYGFLAPILDGVFSSARQSVNFAKSIYDYVSYQNNYNETAAALLAEDDTIMDRLRYYADAQQRSYYGNLSAVSPYGRAGLWATKGSISTIAGSTLAARISTHFYAQHFAPNAAYRFAVLVGDYAPLTSFFALANLTRYPAFTGLPHLGSALAVELISPASAAVNVTATGLPPSTQLSVRFRFRNGTGIEGTQPFPGSGGDLTPYPLFGRETDDINIPYNDFINAISEISVSGPADWCYQCAAQTLFCAAWNSSIAYDQPGRGSNTGGRHSQRSAGLSNEAAGGIGAAVALLVATLVALLLWFVAGLRIRRTEPLWISRKRRSELGGFKGSRKLASDADLPGTAAAAPVGRGDTVVGATAEKRAGADGGVQDGHARVGSWEMKDAPATTSAGSSLQQRENGFGDMKPWALGHERVNSDGTLAERDMGTLGGLDGARLGWGSRDDGGLGSRRISADSGHVDPFRDPEVPVRPNERV